jgi:PiT family inorganic phosphate transporter
LDISVWFFITSGLFLGWSLGANHAVNVFGTAVVSKMVKFRTAAIIAGLFVILGSVVSGGGTTKTINELGSVNALAGSFSVALAVGIAVTFMTKAQLPVSTSQAVIGGIIGWNFFTGSPTDLNTLSKILFSWIASPVIAALFAFLIFKLFKKTVLKWKVHLLEIDQYTRIGLIIVGALASYSLGANNIANVMGMFISAPLFNDLNILGLFTFSGVEQLFFLGGLAISIGIFTYGYNVMETVGTDLYKISPITGFVVVLAEFLVLTLFTSQTLESLLLNHGLPAFPLVPLSTTQAFIGAVIGVGLAKDPLSINFKVLGKIAVGWGVAPVSAGLITFISLFFIQNVFEQKVIHPVPYEISASVITRISQEGIDTTNLSHIVGKRFFNTKIFRNELLSRRELTNNELFLIFNYSTVDSFKIDSILVLDKLDLSKFSVDQISQLKTLHGKSFSHKVDFDKAVFGSSSNWNKTGDKLANRELEEKISVVEELFRVTDSNNKIEKQK